MKRIIIALLTVLLAAAPLAGCTGNVMPEPTAAPTAQVTAAPTEAPAVTPEELVMNASIIEGVHEREEEYSALFSTHALILPGLTVHMENTIYDEANLRECAVKLLSELASAEEATGAEPSEVTVWIVKTTVHFVPETVGEQVFCSLDDIGSDAHRSALMGAAYGLSAEWQRVGLNELVFNEAADDGSLRGYYASGEHDLTASCSALHLAPYLAGDETADAARRTACSIAQYVIESSGFEAFRETVCTASVLPEWAQSIGLEKAPELPDGAELVTGLNIAPASRWMGVITLENITAFVNDDSFIKTADELYDFFCGYLAGMELVMEQIRTEAPSILPLAEERLGESITIFIRDEMTPTYAYPYQNKIDLGRSDAIWHETVHLLLEPYTDNDRLAWICEGLAEHFSFAATSEYCREYYESSGFEAYLELFEDVSGKEPTEDDMTFHNAVWEIYNELNTGSGEYDDQGAYSRAYAISSLLLGDRLSRMQIRRIYDVSVALKRNMTAGPRTTDGNQLTYPQAELLLDYMFRHYGADAVIEAYLGGNTADSAIGVTYRELFIALMDELTETYGFIIPED